MQAVKDDELLDSINKKIRHLNRVKKIKKDKQQN